MPKKPKAKRIGDLQLVENTKRKFGSYQEYYFVRLQFPNGKEYPFLFTDTQLDTAWRRAKENPEDLLAAGIIRNALD